MALMVRAYPFTGSNNDLQAFLDWVDEKKAEVTDMYRRYKITHESWHRQTMGDETFVIGVAMVEDPAAAATNLGKSTHPFDVQFKQRVQALTAVNIQKHPAGPPTEMIYDFSDPQCPLHHLCTI